MAKVMAKAWPERTRRSFGDVQVITQDDAERDAAAAAARASVVVGELDTVAGLREAADLFSRIWDTPALPPMPHDIMRSLVHAGGQVHAAVRDGHLVGAAVAVFSAPADAACYSLIAGVSPGAESRGIGLALKLAQRAWALRVGTSRMRWPAAAAQRVVQYPPAGRGRHRVPGGLLR